MPPLFEHYGVGLWMPEAGGRVDFTSEHDEQTMTYLGLSSKREVARTSIRVRTAMAVQVRDQGRCNDGTGELTARRDLGANLVLVVRAVPALLRYVVEKGSIAIAGVSLTVNAVDGDGLSVAIIPHTRDHTTLGDLAIGDRVNLEVDILAKHVEKLLGGPR